MCIIDYIYSYCLNFTNYKLGNAPLPLILNTPRNHGLVRDLRAVLWWPLPVCPCARESGLCPGARVSVCRWIGLCPGARLSVY